MFTLAAKDWAVFIYKGKSGSNIGGSASCSREVFTEVGIKPPPCHGCSCPPSRLPALLSASHLLPGPRQATAAWCQRLLQTAARVFWRDCQAGTVLQRGLENHGWDGGSGLTETCRVHSRSWLCTPRSSIAWHLPTTMYPPRADSTLEKGCGFWGAPKLAIVAEPQVRSGNTCSASER